MFHILGFVFLFILVILIIGLGIIAIIVRKVFNFGSRTAPNRNQRNWQSAQNNYDDEREKVEQDLHPHRKKIFSDDEGEYVDFEEIYPEDKKI